MNAREFLDTNVLIYALNGACTTLHIEDMQPGHVVDTLTLRNPFLAQP